MPLAFVDRRSHRTFRRVLAASLVLLDARYVLSIKLISVLFSEGLESVIKLLFASSRLNFICYLSDIIFNQFSRTVI